MDYIKIGIGVSSIGRFLPFIGKAAGAFERRGIAVEVVNQQDEEKVVVDIAARDTPIGTPNAPSLIFSLLDGRDLVVIAGILNRPAFYLASRADITGVPDLNGKKVGINQPRRMAGMVMHAMLRRWGLADGRDLTLVDLGLNDRSLEALRSGHVDAALLPPEKAFLAEQEGFRLVADSLALDCHWVPLATTRSFLEERPEVVRRVLDGYRESLRVFKQDPQLTLDEIRRRLPVMAKSPRVLERCYRVFSESFEPGLRPSLSSIEAALREAALQDARAATVRPESLVELVA